MSSLDDLSNNLFAMGALLLALHGDGIKAYPTYEGDRIVSLTVRFPVLRSDYRVFIERVPGYGDS